MKSVKITYLVTIFLLFQFGFSYGNLNTDSANAPASQKITAMLKSMLKPSIPFVHKKNIKQQQTSAEPVYSLVVPQTVVDGLKSSDAKTKAAITSALSLQGNETAQLAGYNFKADKVQNMENVVKSQTSRKPGIVLICVGAGVMVFGIVGFVWTMKMAKFEACWAALVPTAIYGLGALLLIVGSVSAADNQAKDNQDTQKILFDNETLNKYQLDKKSSGCTGGSKIAKHHRIAPHIGNIYSIGATLIADKNNDTIACKLAFVKRGSHKSGDDFIVDINQSQIAAGEKSQVKADFIPVSGDVQGG